MTYIILGILGSLAVLVFLAKAPDDTWLETIQVVGSIIIPAFVLVTSVVLVFYGLSQVVK